MELITSTLAVLVGIDGVKFLHRLIKSLNYANGFVKICAFG